MERLLLVFLFSSYLFVPDRSLFFSPVDSYVLLPLPPFIPLHAVYCWPAAWLAAPNAFGLLSDCWQMMSKFCAKYTIYTHIHVCFVSSFFTCVFFLSGSHSHTLQTPNCSAGGCPLPPSLVQPKPRPFPPFLPL